MSKINDLINEFKAPKNRYNSFGKYNFRDNEGIETALKPMLKKFNVHLESTSSISEVAGEAFLKITHKLYDLDDEMKPCIASGSAYTAFDLNKKGMDKGQASGATQSYCSKYAYGMLLRIDDVKDADELNGKEQQTKPKPVQKFKMSELAKKVEAGEMTREAVTRLVKAGKVINDMEKK